VLLSFLNLFTEPWDILNIKSEMEIPEFNQMSVITPVGFKLPYGWTSEVFKSFFEFVK
jgi:hypothetical protein